MKAIARTILSNVYWLKKEIEAAKQNSGNLRFYNYWSATPQDSWLCRFVNHRNILSESDKLAFFSVFGPRWFVNFFPNSYKKVFFTGENVHSPIAKSHQVYADNCVNNVNLSLGFDYLDHPNYLRFPLWMMYLVPYNATFEDVKNTIEKINNPEHRLNSERTRFACLIASHDLNGIRTKITDALEKISSVTYAGAFRKNTSELQTDFNNDKLAYLRNFKFNICPENSSEKGYVTEKIVDAFRSGNIPIYWGGAERNSVEPEIFDKNSYVYCDFNNLQGLIDEVSYLHSNPKAYEEFVQIRPFSPQAAEIIWEKIQELEKRIKHLF